MTEIQYNSRRVSTPRVGPVSMIQIGTALAKRVFEVAPGVLTSWRRLFRAARLRFSRRPSARGSPPGGIQLGHHWGREAQRTDHHVTLSHPLGICSKGPWFEESLDTVMAA